MWKFYVKIIHNIACFAPRSLLCFWNTGDILEYQLRLFLWEIWYKYPFFLSISTYFHMTLMCVHRVTLKKKKSILKPLLAFILPCKNKPKYQLACVYIFVMYVIPFIAIYVRIGEEKEVSDSYGNENLNVLMFEFIYQ